MNRSRFYILILVELSLIVLFILFFQVNSYFVSSGKPFPEPKTIVISRGMSIQKAAEMLADSSVIKNKEDFINYIRLFGKGKTIKYGIYSFSAPGSPAGVFNLLNRGESQLIKVTFPEGMRLKDYASILKKKLKKDSLRFIRLATSSRKAREYGINAPNLEGFLLPETYLLDPLSGEEKILGMLVENSLKIYEKNREGYEKRGLSMLEVATMASLVEGECQLDEERPIVASVYYNRLKKHMKLQADPTIQYLLKDGPRRLLNKDLKIDSPYNTYRNYGLPPGPINNPGRRSILAAIYPAETEYIYFVARGDGGHYFAKTWREHLANKKKFDSLRRKVARERRRKGAR